MFTLQAPESVSVEFKCCCFSSQLLSPNTLLQGTLSTCLSWPSVATWHILIRPWEFWTPVSTLKLSKEVEGLQFQTLKKHRGYVTSSLRHQKLSCPWQQNAYPMPGWFKALLTPGWWYYHVEFQNRVCCHSYAQQLRWVRLGQLESSIKFSTSISL